MKGDEIVRACDRHSNENVTLKKRDSKYKNMSNFSENLRVVAIKLIELIQVASPNLSIYFGFLLFCYKNKSASALLLESGG